ncbi:MAG: putative homoserine dehydrogenase-like protein [Saprospiraceae bacterium]
MANQANPGMELAFIADHSLEAANKSASLSKQSIDNLVISNNAAKVLYNEYVGFTVLLESTNSIASAAEYWRVAIARKKHVVLMNAEGNYSA